MNVLIDHLAAVVVGGTIFLLLVAGQHRSQRTAIEATSYYMQKQQQLAFIELMRRDLQGVSRFVTVMERPVDSSFVFFAQTAQTDTTKREVAYRRMRVGERDGVALYQVVRFVDGQRAGASPATLTEWEIVARNEEGGAIQRPADGRQLYVRFELAEAIRGTTPLPRTPWEATFYPPLLGTERAL